MSETPRTDALCLTPCGYDSSRVSSDFARQLERELAAVTRERDRLRRLLNPIKKCPQCHGSGRTIDSEEGGIEIVCDCWTATSDSLRKELAEAIDARNHNRVCVERLASERELSMARKERDAARELASERGKERDNYRSERDALRSRVEELERQVTLNRENWCMDSEDKDKRYYALKRENEDMQGKLGADLAASRQREEEWIQELRQLVAQLEADLRAPASWREKIPPTLKEWEDMRKQVAQLEEALRQSAEMHNCPYARAALNTEEKQP